MTALQTALPPGWRWQWREVPYGPCPRCRWPANTLAPNGSPFHAFCWGNPDPPTTYDQYQRRLHTSGERPERPAFVPERQGEVERQWCATERRWFDPTPERLEACADHAVAVMSRWTR
jgi:hypothetical protein